MIARATLRDLDAIVLLEREGFPDKLAYNRRQFRHLISRARGAVLVDKAAGALRGVAVVLWRRDASVGRIHDLVVRAQHRRAGVGRGLLQVAERHARRRGLRALSIEVAEANTPARKLYESFGFRPYKRLPDYYGDGEHGLRLRKPLE
ncbi:MAG: N-acetyltransferase [Dehalococcoidia bacterium]|nr:N-acetyltransferase [Dehalococcoidia bacterium]